MQPPADGVVGNAATCLENNVTEGVIAACSGCLLMRNSYDEYTFFALS